MAEETTREETEKAEFRKKFHKRYDADVRKVIDYLGLNSGGLNIDAMNKQIQMKRTLAYMKKWHKGTYNEWINRLSLRMNMTVRTVRENYVDPLISEGIVQKTGSQVVFVGIPDESVQ